MADLSRVDWVLLDRDGTINVGAPEPDYITSALQVRLLPRAGEAIARLNAAGLPVAIVTNQRGVARGLMSAEDLEAVNARLCELLAPAHVETLLSCTHHADSCDCRKPQPGLLRQAAQQLGLPLDSAVMIGDAETDVEAGQRAGTATIRLAPEATTTAADLRVPSLWDAVDAILGRYRG